MRGRRERGSREHGNRERGRRPGRLRRGRAAGPLGALLAGLLAGLPAAAIEPDRGPVPCGGVVFRAALDGPGDAEQGMGALDLGFSDGFDGRPVGDEFRFVPGRIGRAIDLSDAPARGVDSRGARATFSARGHLPLRSGALAFFVQARSQPWSVTVRSQSNDAPRLMPLFDLTGRLDRLQLQMRSRGYELTRLEGPAPDLARPGWHHVGIAWSEDAGVRLYVDGRPRLETGGARGFRPGWLSVGGFELRGARFDELVVVDGALDASAWQALARGERPTAPSVCRAAAIDPAVREAQLSWRRGAGAVGVAGPVRIRSVGLRQALALRSSGWRAVDGRHDSVWPLRYMRYTYRRGGGLHLRPERDERIDFVRTVGGLSAAVLTEGEAIDGPGAQPVLARLTGEHFVTTHRLATPFAGEALSLYRRPQRKERGQWPAMLHDLALLRVDAGAAPRDPERVRGYLGSGSADTLAGIHRAQLLHWYPPGERDVRLFDRSGAGGGELRVDAHRWVHLALPARDLDRSLGAVRLRLDVDGWRAGNRLRLRVHDPFNPWRALTEVDVGLEADGGVDLALEFPPTIWPAGVELLVSAVSAQAGTWRGDSFVAAHGPERAEARSSHRRQQHRLLKDSFAALSEPRPWRNNRGEDRFLRIASPAYDGIALLSEDLVARHPENLWAQGYRVWLHPRDEALWRSLPDQESALAPGDAPRWARLQRGLLGLQLDYAHWWIDQRQIENGELGTGLGDDTDLVTNWTSLALIHDPDRALETSLRRVADLTWKTLIRNGLNIKMTDVLHAYEEGINVQPFAALLDYGNPVLVERLMETARRYEDFLLTPPKQGRRRLKGAWFDTENMRVGAKWNRADHEDLILHPGLMLVWYNRHPGMLQMMQEFYEGTKGTRDRGRRQPGLLHALYEATGDARYAPAGPQTRTDPIWSRWLATSPAPSPLLKRLRDVRFPDSGVSVLANTDFRTVSKWLLWRLTGVESDLDPGLLQDWKQAVYSQGLRTRTGQSGDRVPINKNLTDFMYLGGPPGSRGHLFPLHAVSYEGFPRDFAALVLEDGGTSLRWLGIAAAEPIEDATLRVWRLQPGRYEVRMGADRDADGRIDRVSASRTLALQRGEGIPVSLAPGVRTIVEVSQVEAGPPLWPRSDLAVTHEDAQLRGGNVTVQVHNIGTSPSGAFEVELRDANGRSLGSRSHPGLEGVRDLKPKRATFRFQGVPTSGRLEVVVEGAAPEITARNNRARLRE
ncbi:MAG: hypothetical protein ACQGVK_26415 [Myxococcota bacterium]